jgi:hypothetical protein
MVSESQLAESLAKYFLKNNIQASAAEVAAFVNSHLFEEAVRNNSVNLAAAVTLIDKRLDDLDTVYLYRTMQGDVVVESSDDGQPSIRSMGIDQHSPLQDALIRFAKQVSQ